jgi:diadenosine tetraphosphate (Ap4A) HIT family hydrolase
MSEAHSATADHAACVLCREAGGEVLWRDDALRVVAAGGAEGADYPGFCRVIWNAHVAELSDLDRASRERVMQVVYVVEQVLRATLAPHKINLASLGNEVPHLHWHIIPRYQDDAHFPAPIWAPRRREPDAARLTARRDRAAGLPEQLQRALA